MRSRDAKRREDQSLRADIALAASTGAESSTPSGLAGVAIRVAQSPLLLGPFASRPGETSSFIPKRKDGSHVLRDDGRPKVVTKNAAGAKGKTWSSNVAGAAFEAMVEHDLPLVRGEPLVIEIDFYAPRPQSHYRTGRCSNFMRDGAPAAPCVRPDVDKLISGVLDALTNVLYSDDGQIARAVGTKHFGEPARAEIRIARFVPETSEGVPEDAQLSLAAV
jgi:Holliday junction resolvase RusA-like endonuclease